MAVIAVMAGPVTPPEAGMTSPAFPTDNMCKCPEPAYVESARALAGATQAGGALGDIFGALGVVPVTFRIS